MSSHRCPGGCGAQVAYARLSCPPCWARLPKPLRDEVTSTYRQQYTEPLRHVRAVSAALLWYRAEQP